MDGWKLLGTRWTAGGHKAQGQAAEWTWAELLGKLEEPTTMPPGEGPEPDNPKARKEWMNGRKAHISSWSPVRFERDYRNTENAIDAGALLLDVDSSPGEAMPKRGEPALDPDKLRAAMDAALPSGTAWAAHTTASSRPNAWRWRVIVPLSERVTPDTRKVLAAMVRRKLGEGDAPAMVESDPDPTMDVARFWYAPAIDADAPDAYTHVVTDGDPLHVPLWLDMLQQESGLLDRAELATYMVERCEAMRAQLWPAEQVAVADLLDDALATMRARAAGEETPIPLPWGSVAAPLGGGLWPGLHVLVGSTGAGKSQWGLQAGLHAAVNGHPVLYIGLELGTVDLVARCLAMLAKYTEEDLERIPKWSKLYLGKSTKLLDRMSAAPAELLRTLPISFEIAGPMGWPAKRLGAAVEDLQARWGSRTGKPPLVVLDYLQVVASAPDERQDLRERIGRAAYEGRAVARECDAAVLLVSSTARENYSALSGDNKSWLQPASKVVGLGKESGEIEFAADSVMALVAEPWRDKDSDGQACPPKDGTHVHLAVAKVRAGRSRWVELRFDGGSFWEPDIVGDDARPVGWVPVRTETRKPCEVALTMDAAGRLALLVQEGTKEPEVRPLNTLDDWHNLDLRPCLDGDPAKEIELVGTGGLRGKLL